MKTINFRTSFSVRKACFTLMLFVAGFGSQLRAQMVTIPDANFVTFLQANFPSCMSGNQMNISCSGIVNTTYINISSMNISNLEGIQYFTDLTQLYCRNNQLTSLPTLPLGLTHIDSYNNQLLSLPTLPNGLTNLDCGKNNLTSLPTLPASLLYLYCSINELTSLPALPSAMTFLYFADNQISTIPTLPPMLEELNCANNLISCLPELPTSITFISNFSGNSFTCVPNYINNYYIQTYPLCEVGDVVNNPNDCYVVGGIAGIAFENLNLDCNYNSSVDNTLQNIEFDLYDGNGDFVGTQFSYASGAYHFQDLNPDNYTVELELTGKPYTVLCLNPGSTENVTLSSTNDVERVDFSVVNTGFENDLAITSIVPVGFIFPGQPHTLNIDAGMISNFYGFNPTTTISCQLVVTVSGPVSVIGAADGSITPTSIIDNVVTYDVEDFASLDFFNSFNLNLSVDSLSTNLDSICINATLICAATETIYSNNYLHMCYGITNSYDPNKKTVYPAGDLTEGYADPLLYTIYFQNTGNAPAFNIRLEDDVDFDFDASSFELLGYSHPVQASLLNNHLTFRFNNIMLPDSTTNPEGSIGYVQYRITPKAGLPIGTTLENTAGIYFDYNSPIITNTTVNTYVQNTASTPDLAKADELSVFPNPANNQVNIKGKGITHTTMQNALGQIVYSSNTHSDVLNIDVTAIPQGIYFINCETVNGVEKVKLVVRH